MEVGGYTFDFEQLVVDKNGNGMLSYTISNPDGVKAGMNPAMVKLILIGIQIRMEDW